MKPPSTTFRVNGRTYSFTLGKPVPYLFRLGTRRAPPLTCEARVSFVSADETEPLIRLVFLHPRLRTEETRWLSGTQFWRAAPGPAEAWLQSQAQLFRDLAEPGGETMSRDCAIAALQTGKRLSRRLALLRGRDLLHLLTSSERTFLTQGYGSIRRYYLGPFLPESRQGSSWQEQQERGQAFKRLRKDAGLSVYQFALLDAALLEIQHEQAIDGLLSTASLRAVKSDT